jgi:hypothetical protein
MDLQVRDRVSVSVQKPDGSILHLRGTVMSASPGPKGLVRITLDGGGTAERLQGDSRVGKISGGPN